MKKVTIVDCNIGNRLSICNMLRKIGLDPKISRDKDDILNSDILILPGIGAFDSFMEALSNYDLIDTLNQAVLKNKTPIIGICLGMQILFESSEEGKLSGLNWIRGKVSHLKQNFIASKSIKLPHIGWKSVLQDKSSLIANDNKFYFVHNYHCKPQNSDHIMGTIQLDSQRIVAAVKKDNVYGVQFHPEKSHHYGMDFFERFIQDVS